MKMVDLDGVFERLALEVREQIAESRVANKAPCVGIAACLAKVIQGLGPLPKELCEPSPDGYRRVRLFAVEEHNVLMGKPEPGRS